MKIKLLDGKEIEFEKGQTGLDIAKSISTSLAKILFSLSRIVSLFAYTPTSSKATIVRGSTNCFLAFIFSP